MNFYEGDSFHTLTMMGQIGLLALSFALTIVTLWGAHCIMRGRPFLVRLLIAFITLSLFVWLSPQIYYVYYLTLFDGLPLQIVIKTPLSPLQIARILIFQAPSTLSAHGIALLGWGLIVVAALRR